MAETISTDPDPTQYWCYNCNKRVPVETLPDHPDLICFECKNGFIESISPLTDPSFGDDFLHILSLIAQAPPDDDEPPPPPSDHPAAHTDYLRIELNGVRPHFHNTTAYDNFQQPQPQEEEENDNQNEEEEEENDDDDDEVDLERLRLRIRLRDFASRAASRRNRILDWAEILMGLEDQSTDAYVGNPGDYVDAAGYEALLQALADGESGGRRGAPPAAKAVIEGLKTVAVESGDVESICAVCKDGVFGNEGKVVKQLECGHVYHGECIVPWLNSKNSCPVCRFELPTDDPEYEEDRKKRVGAVDHGCSSSSGGVSGGE